MIYGLAIYFGGVLSGSLAAIFVIGLCMTAHDADSEDRHSDYTKPRVMPKIREGKP